MHTENLCDMVITGAGLLEVEAEECSKWLALLQVCCHVFKLGMQAELDESSGSLVQNNSDSACIPSCTVMIGFVQHVLW